MDLDEFVRNTLRMAVEKDPEDAAAALNLGLFLFDQDRMQEATPYLEKARQVGNPSDQAFLTALIRQGEIRAKMDALWKAATIARLAPRQETSWLSSKPCRLDDLESAAFRRWIDRMRERPRLTRKLWEWCYIAQALYEREMLGPGKRGLSGARRRCRSHDRIQCFIGG